MASTFLTQALLTLPGNPNLCPPRKSGLSAAVSGRFSSCCRVSISRVSLSPVVAAPTRRRSFVVRAEEEAAAENAEVVAEEATEAEEEAESEAVAVEEKLPRKPYVKLGDVMGILNKRAIEARDGERPIPDVRVGDIVQILKQVPTRRRNVATYKGIVIGRQNAGIHTTIRIRRIIAGVGVEIVFALYSPNIKEITVIRHRKVRRAKLYYLRDKLPRFSTFK